MNGTLANAVAVKEEIQRNKDRPAERTRERFADFAASWLRSKTVAPSTEERYTNALAHWLAEIGDIYVDSIEVRDIRAAVRKWQAQSIAPATINGWVRVLRVALDDPMQDGILPGNPARVTRALPESPTSGARGRVLEAEEFRQLVEAIKHLEGDGITSDVVPLLLTLCWTGVRRGEALALKWEDIADDEIHIRRSVWKRNEKPTKTRDPRLVPLAAPLRQTLADHRQAMIKEQHPGLASGLVFLANPAHALAGARRRGDPEISWYRSPSVVDAPLVKACEAAGVPRVSPHGLRRTSENMLRRAGVEKVVRKSMAGWRTDSAQGIYTEVSRAERSEAAEALVRLVMGGRK